MIQAILYNRIFTLLAIVWPPYCVTALLIENNTISIEIINPEPDIDLTVIDQLAVAKETFIFEARIGSVGPVILY